MQDTYRGTNMGSPSKTHGFYGREYVIALRQHYPHLVEGERKYTVDRELHIGIVRKWMENLDVVGVDGPDRYQSILDRSWASERSAWAVPAGGRNLRYAGVYCSYKGLINLKPASDLVLYSNLIWELQPRTVLEFGSLQGGSALWFSDQLDVLCGDGEVHSFEYCYKCISSRASHPRLYFHKADLRDLATLNSMHLGRLPHPWLVIDDAHVNLENLVPFVASFMVSGDYYVVEDVFLHHPRRARSPRSPYSPAMIVKVVSAYDRLGFRVDAKYADAFGLNVTCAPNGWLVKQ